MMQNTHLLLRIVELGQGGYSLTVHSSDDSHVINTTLPINDRTLETRIKTIQGVFNDIVVKVGNRISLEPSEKRGILELLANEGYDAFADLAGTVNDPAFKLLNTEIDMLPSGGTVKVIADSFSLPWEILTIQPDANKLWGLSYIIQRQIVRNGNPNTLRTGRIEASTPPKVGLLALKHSSLPAIMHDEVPFFTDLHSKKIIVCNLLESLNPKGDKKTEMDKLREFASINRHIYHFACEVVGDPNPARIKLVITDWFPITPDDLRRDRIVFNGKPLIVLNACDTGKVDHPFHTSDLISNLLKTEIQGIVATESKMPDQFASAFIMEFYDRLLSGYEIGMALQSTRHFFLKEHNNPLGLFYSLYQVSPHWKIVLRPLPDQGFGGKKNET